MPRIAYYAELDPFSGSISQTDDAFPILLRDLKILLLLYDAVIVQPGNLLDHGLTLPAFEALAPFVRAGRLTTTVDPSSANPRAFLDESLALYADPEPTEPTARQRWSRPTRTQRRRELAQLRARWRDLLPETWPMTRNVGAQTAGFTALLHQFFVVTARPSRATGWALRILDEVLQAGRRVSRTDLLARLSTLRGELPPGDLARLALVIQATYLHQGVLAHATTPADVPNGNGFSAVCQIWAGPFAAILRENDAHLNGLALPAFDWHASPASLARRMGTLGIHLASLLALDTDALFSLSQSPAWHRLRTVLDRRELLASAAQQIDLSPNADAGTLLEALDRATPVLDAIGPTRPFSGASIALPAPWQLAAQAGLGTLQTSSAVDPTITLDLRTLDLGDGHRSLRLSRPQAELVAALAAAGAVGLALQDLKQLTLDMDRLRSSAGALEPQWSPQEREPPRQDAARRVRVAVLLTRLNHLLATLDLRAQAATENGRWRLTHRGAPARTLRIVGTVWDLLRAPPPREPPPGLSSNHHRLWAVLAEATPCYVSLHRLMDALGRAADDRGPQQTIEAIHKTNAELAAHDSPLRIVRVKRGLYALLPKSVPLAASPTEVR